MGASSHSGKEKSETQAEQAGRQMDGCVFRNISQRVCLQTSPLSQAGPLGPQLETGLCYWIQSLKAIKLHSKHSIQYTLPLNLECGK